MFSACASTPSAEPAPPATQAQVETTPAPPLSTNGNPTETSAIDEPSTSGASSSLPPELAYQLSPIWLIPEGSVGNPMGVIAGRIITIEEEAASISALDPSSGSIIWSAYGFQELSYVGELGGSIVIASDGNLTRVDPATGTVVFQVAADGNVIGLTDDGVLQLTSGTRDFDTGLAVASSVQLPDLPNDARPIGDGSMWVTGCRFEPFVSQIGRTADGVVVAEIEGCLDPSFVRDDGITVAGWHSMEVGTDGQYTSRGSVVIDPAAGTVTDHEESDFALLDSLDCPGNILTRCVDADLTVGDTSGFVDGVDSIADLFFQGYGPAVAAAAGEDGQPIPTEAPPTTIADPTAEMFNICENPWPQAVWPRLGPSVTACVVEGLNQMIVFDVTTGVIYHRQPVDDIDLADDWRWAGSVGNTFVVTTGRGAAEGFAIS